MNPEDLQAIWKPPRPLIRLSPRDWKGIAFASTVFTLYFTLFHLMGTQSGIGNWGRSSLLWLVERWRDSGISMGSGDYSHGFLVPIASLYVVWSKRDTLIRAHKTPLPWAVVLVALCLLIHYVGYKTQHHRLSALSLIGLCWSIPLYLYGAQVARHLLFPCAFLLFAVPLNFLDSLTFPLRLVNTHLSVGLLQFLGLEVRQVGTAIYGPPFDATASLKLDVADPCSGIRSLTAMMALTAIYGYLMLPGIWRKWTLFVCAIPLAMAGNMFRIVSIAIMAVAFNEQLATGLPHDYAGFITFGFAISLMVALSLVLKREFHLPGRPDVRF